MKDNYHIKQRLFCDQTRCLGCKTCELRCAVERSSISKTLTGAMQEEILPRTRVYVQWDGQYSMPLQCRQCDDAPCVEICSTRAMRRDEESGCVYIDGERCISCWMCIMVCPYGIIAPATERHTADKCDQCFQMEEPYCVAACPTGALQLMTLEEYEQYLIMKRKNILPDSGF